MRFGSVCSGIEAASVAWGPLGWSAAWLSEIKPFPSAVLQYLKMYWPNLSDDELEKLAKDGPQYKAYGNSMVVPVMRWLGNRIKLIIDRS